MRKSLFMPPTMLAALVGICAPASAQGHDKCPLPEGYYRDTMLGCLHRYPAGVLQGLPLRWDECNRECIHSNETPQANKPPVYRLATPNQVMAALACDLIAAAKGSQGKATELSKAVIDGALTFTLVG